MQKFILDTSGWVEWHHRGVTLIGSDITDNSMIGQQIELFLESYSGPIRSPDGKLLGMTLRFWICP